MKKKARAPALERLPRTASAALGSDQAPLQHTGAIDYGCFLSDLTGFAGAPLSRTQPSTLQTPNLTKEQDALKREFNLAKADCELQDTANFPSSAGKTNKDIKAKRQRSILSQNDANTRG